MSKLHDSHTESRGQWGRQIEFFLTLVGYAVGLGNVWRFPYLCYKNGGGAFLIPYFLCMFLLGIPLFALEVAFGQYGSRGPVTIWYIGPAFKGVGLAAVFGSTIIQIYYGVVIAWGMFYLFASMTDTLPWTSCDRCSCFLFQEWRSSKANQTEMATGQQLMAVILNATGKDCSNYTDKPVSPSEIYFNERALRVSDSIETLGDMHWEMTLCNLASWFIVFLVLCRGIQSLGKVVYFTATIPYVILTVLLVRGIMMEGSMLGITFYLTPNFSRLQDANVWSDAAVQIFFSLSACQGGLIAMSSYNKFNNNILREALVVPIINCMTSVFSGFVVFSVLGHIAYMEHTGVANVTKGGPGLAFVVYPDALAQMPIAPLWSMLFFSLFCILGFSSQFSLVETSITSMFDEFPDFFEGKKRKYIYRACWCFLCFLLGLPITTQGGSYLLDLIDGAILGFPSLVVGVCELIAIIWVYGWRRFSQDIELMVGMRPYLFLPCWLFISPVLIVMVIISAAAQHNVREPWWAEVIYWLIVATPIVCIPAWYLYYMIPRGGFKSLEKFKILHRPKPEWINRRRSSKRSSTNLPRLAKDADGYLGEKDALYSNNEKQGV